MRIPESLIELNIIAYLALSSRRLAHKIIRRVYLFTQTPFSVFLLQNFMVGSCHAGSHMVHVYGQLKSVLFHDFVWHNEHNIVR